MNLLSALPELKRKEFDSELYDLACQENGEIAGYNQALDDLSKYQLCEESLKKVISKFADKVWAEEHRNIHEIHHEDLAKELLSSLPLWLRKESK